MATDPPDDEFDGDDPARRLYRRGDPRTSRWSGEFIEPLRTKYRRRVWAYALECGDTGFTDWELEQAMAEKFQSERIKSTSTYRSRRNELHIDGLILDSERTKNHPHINNRMRIIWVRRIFQEDGT